MWLTAAAQTRASRLCAHQGGSSVVSNSWVRGIVTVLSRSGRKYEVKRHQQHVFPHMERHQRLQFRKLKLY